MVIQVTESNAMSRSSPDLWVRLSGEAFLHHGPFCEFSLAKPEEAYVASINSSNDDDLFPCLQRHEGVWLSSYRSGCDGR